MAAEKLPCHTYPVLIVSHLLFADDNESMRNMVRALLEASGHTVELAPDGAAALASVHAREPDLLILDLEMPGMSGFEVCRAVKQNPFTARVPVLMLTGQGDVSYKVAGFEAGADDYLAKPFDPRELRARVAALLRLVRREADRNPTSGLPGGLAIEAEVLRRVRASETFAVVYLDLDNFKAFGDSFGFAVADQAIRELGSTLRSAVESAGGPGDFVGHIGGDDFLVITAERTAPDVVRVFNERFRGVVSRLVGDDVVRDGTFRGVDRTGAVRAFPVGSASAAVLVVDPARWVSMAELGAHAANVKSQAKERGGGAMLIGAV
jgi:PleD family two-component response regulator